MPRKYQHAHIVRYRKSSHATIVPRNGNSTSRSDGLIVALRPNRYAAPNRAQQQQRPFLQRQPPPRRPIQALARAPAAKNPAATERMATSPPSAWTSMPAQTNRHPAEAKFGSANFERSNKPGSRANKKIRTARLCAPQSTPRIRRARDAPQTRPPRSALGQTAPVIRASNRKSRTVLAV